MKKQIFTLVLLGLLCSVGNAWGAAGDSYTWTFVNETGNNIDLSAKTTEFTSASGSKKLNYVGGSSCKIEKDKTYLAPGGASSFSSNSLNARYFTFKAPSANGTISIVYAGTVGGVTMIRTSNGDYQTITPEASTEKISSLIDGLTAGTTDIYIAFTSKTYFTSITWTEASAPAGMELLYESDYKATMEDGATLSSTATETTGGSGWVSSYSKYYKAGSTNKEATITFSPALSLNSNGDNCGRIRIYYGSTGHSNNTTVLNDFKINSGSSIGTTYGVLEKEKVHILDYTIPTEITSLTTVYAKIAVSNGCLLHIEVLTNPSGGAVSYTVSYDSNGGTGNISDGTGESVTLSDGTGFTAPLGYSFDGWNTASDGSGTDYAAGVTVTRNLSLYAKWKKSFSLNANTSNHGVSDGAVVAYYNGAITISSHATGQAGYALLGYYTAETDGTKILNSDGSFASDDIDSYVDDGKWVKSGETIPLYAQWELSAEYRTVINTAFATNLPTGSTKDGITYNYHGAEYTDANGIKLNDSSSDYFHITTGSLGSIIKVVLNVKVGTSSDSKGIKYGFVASDGTVSTTKNSLSTSFEEVTLTPDEETTNFKVMRNGTGVYIKDITVYYRPSCHIQTLTSGKWASFCPSIDVSVPSGVTAYKGVVSGSDVVLTPIGQNTIKAGVGVILKASADGSYTFSTTTASAFADNSLLGTTVRKARNTSKVTYALYEDGEGVQKFTKYEGGYIPANKAYIELDSEVSLAPSAFRIVDEEENATNIHGVEAIEKAVKFIENGQLLIRKDGVVYDMTGRIVK